MLSLPVCEREMSHAYTDRPKSLGLPEVRAHRLAMIYDAHIAPLTNFIEQVRRTEALGKEIPYFDPLDGGIHAKALIVFEAPGPKAVKSGFISRNNPDEFAKNVFSY